MHKSNLVISFFVVSITFHAKSQFLNSLRDVHEISAEEKIRIREMMSISKNLGDKIWQGYSKLPFPFLIIHDSIEYQVNYSTPPSDFKKIGFDSLLNSDVHVRKRKLPKVILSAFPIVSNGIPFIVAGTTENIKINSTQWVIKVLHERFHQLQQSYDGFMTQINTLGLAGNDTTGRWMINYPFPYEDSSINKQYKKYSKALGYAVNPIGHDNFESGLLTFKTERSVLLKILNPLDQKYFSLQMWLEGVAMFTEYKFLTLLENYKPSDEFRNLPDYMDFAEYRRRVVASQSYFLDELDIRTGRRDCFYTMGYGECRLIDSINPNWQKKYFIKLFFIEEYSKVLSH